MQLPRRFLVLAALMFWLGGFTFYAAVVVPVGQRVLGSHLRQGFITREVTNYLNLTAAVALLPLAWDVLAVRDAAWRRRLRGLLWLAMLLSLIFLCWLHGRLDALLVPKGKILLDPEAFRPGHRLYLWVSTVQWACGLVYLVLTLSSWRTEDRATALRPTRTDTEQTTSAEAVPSS